MVRTTSHRRFAGIHGGEAVTTAPAVYFDISALESHRYRGIGRYVSALLGAFRLLGALDDKVSVNPRDLRVARVVHLPVVSGRRRPALGPDQVLLGTVYDLTPARFPLAVFRPWQVGQLAGYARDLAVLRRCQHLVAISYATARDTERVLRYRADSVSVIHPGLDAAFVGAPPSEGTRTGQVLFVGAASRYKNLPRLVRAFSVVDTATTLVIAGMSTRRQRRRLRRLADRLGVGTRLRFADPMPDRDLVELYRTSDVLVLPSRWEGFGLPALEAMALGTPVVCSDRGSLPEVVGNCAVLVDPTSVSEISAGIQSVLSDPARADRLRACGIQRAQRFSYERAALEHLDLYEALAG